MRPPFAAIGVPVMAHHAPIATVEATSNGILVRYQEAVRRRRRVHSPLAGMDMSYFQMLFEIIAHQMGGEEWEDDKKRSRLEKVKDILKSANAPAEEKYVDRWVAEQRTIFCKDMGEVSSAIQKAYEAYLGIVSIIRDGDTVVPDNVDVQIS